MRKDREDFFAPCSTGSALGPVAAAIRPFTRISLCKQLSILAPALILGQLCDVIDIDGPIFLVPDTPPSIVYDRGFADCPGRLWGLQAGR